jgi:hypothetical protein
MLQSRLAIGAVDEPSQPAAARSRRMAEEAAVAG